MRHQPPCTAAYDDAVQAASGGGDPELAYRNARLLAPMRAWTRCLLAMALIASAATAWRIVHVTRPFLRVCLLLVPPLHSPRPPHGQVLHGVRRLLTGGDAPKGNKATEPEIDTTVVDSERDNAAMADEVVTMSVEYPVWPEYFSKQQTNPSPPMRIPAAARSPRKPSNGPRIPNFDDPPEPKGSKSSNFKGEEEEGGPGCWRTC